MEESGITGVVIPLVVSGNRKYIHNYYFVAKSNLIKIRTSLFLTAQFIGALHLLD